MVMFGLRIFASTGQNESYQVAKSSFDGLALERRDG